MVIPTKGTLEEHLEAVGKVFDALLSAGFAVKCSKVWLAYREAPYLGFMVGKYGTRPQAAKTAAILDLLCEDMGTDPAAAARFAGMVGFYHKFIPNLHSCLAPFHELKAKGADARHIMSSLRFKVAFCHIKHQLATATALARPDYSKPFYVDVDMASSSGAGAALSQWQVFDDPTSALAIAFWSKRFTSEERRYGVRDQECLGLVDALEAWRPYIWGTHTIVRTDHSSLQWMLTTNHADGTRISSYAFRLQGYDIEIQYVPGKLHVVPDCMSRCIPRNTPEGMERGRVDGRKAIEDRVDDAVMHYQSSMAAHAGQGAGDLAGSTRHNAAEGGEEEGPAILDLLCEDRMGTVRSAPFHELKAKGADARHIMSSLRFKAASAVDDAQVRTEGVFNTFATLVDWGDWDPLDNPAISHGFASRGAYEAALRDARGTQPQQLAAEEVAEPFTWVFAHVFQVRDDGNIHVLVEQQGDSMGLPSVRAHVRSPARPQLLRRLIHSYGPDASVVEAIGRAASLKCNSHGMRGKAKAFSVVWRDARPLPTHRNPDLVTLRFVAEAEAMGALSPVEQIVIRRIHGARLTTRKYNGEIATCAVADIAPALPTIADAPHGPAFLRTQADIVQGSRTLYNLCAEGKDKSMSVDLEGVRLGSGGKAATIQISIDMSEGKRCVYVFDLLGSSGAFALGAQGEGTLRSLFESSAVTKVLHCCHGDGGALFYEYGIELNNVFDTGVADSMILYAHPNKPRRLDKVLRTWLGKRGILTHKGEFDDYTLFMKRPLRLDAFTYSYEDVTLGNQVYHRLASQLKQDGLHELALVFSKQKCPMQSLPPKDFRAQPATRICVALADSRHLLCLAAASGTDGLVYSLPVATIPNSMRRADPGVLKQFAREQWCNIMGTPDRGLHKPVRLAIFSRLKKAVRVGDTLVYKACIDDCEASLPVLRDNMAVAFDSAACEAQGLALRPRFNAHGHGAAGLLPEQLELFQYLHMEAARFEPAYDPIHRLHDIVGVDSTAVGLRVDSALAVAEGGRVTLQLTTTVFAAMVAAVEVAKATEAVKTTGDSKNKGTIGASVILHDSSHVFTRADDRGRLSFPTQVIGEGHEVADVAALAFDLFAGVSLRKSTGELQLCPRASQFVRDAQASAVHLGRRGNNEVFSWFLRSQDGLRLADHAAAFYASRRMINGFQLTEKQLGKHPEFALCTVEYAIANLASPYDIAALQDALTAAITAEQRAPLAQRTDSTAVSVIWESSVCARVLAESSDVMLAQRTDNGVLQQEVVAATAELQTAASGDTDWALARTRLRAAYLALNSSRRTVCQTGDSEEATVCVGSADEVGVAVATEQDPVDSDLVTGATAVLYAQLLESSSFSAAEAATTEEPRELSAEGEPKSAAPGLPTHRAPPSTFTRQELLAAQVEHPATSRFIEFLRCGVYPTDASTAKDRAEFTTEAQHYVLDAQDGALLRIVKDHTRGRGGDAASPTGKAEVELLRERRLMVLPGKLQHTVLLMHHDFAGHFGSHKTMETIRRNFWWGTRDEMRKDVSRHLLHCEPCRRARIPRHRAGRAHILEAAQYPFEILSGDVYYVGIDWEGYTHTLDFVCHFTRRVTSIPMQGKPTSEAVYRALLEYVIRVHGKPSEIRSDRDSTLISEALQALYTRLGIRINAASAYHHQLLALCERWHQTLKQLVRIQRAENLDDAWPLRLPLLELAYNNSVNPTTGFSPFYLDHARHAVTPHQAMETPLEVVRKFTNYPEWVKAALQDCSVSHDAAVEGLRLNSLKAKKRYDMKRDVNAAYQPGDRVLLIKGEIMDGSPFPKAAIPTLGPFTVARCLPYDRYMLNDMINRRMHNVVHVSRLIYFPDLPAAEAVWRNSGCEDGGSWPVHSIVGRRRTAGSDPTDETAWDYRVRWLGYGVKASKWVELKYLASVMNLVEHYDTKHGHVRPPLPQVEVPAAPSAPEPAARTRPHFNHNPSHPQPPPQVPLPSTTELAQQHFNYLQDTAATGGTLVPPTSEPQANDSSHEETTPQESDELPTLACQRRGKWEYGRYVATTRGRTLRWFMARAFTEAELDSPHFQALREAVEPAPATDTRAPASESTQTTQNQDNDRRLQRLQRQLA